MSDVDRSAGLIQSDEGIVLVVYDDATGKRIVSGSVVAGNPTIGYGRNLSGRGITADEAAVLFANDLASVRQRLSVYPWYTSLDDVRRAAVENMAFNLGIMGLLGFHQTLYCLALGKWQAASEAILASEAAQQLPDRYARLARMIATGQWPGGVE